MKLLELYIRQISRCGSSAGEFLCLVRANLRGANLRWANFRWADLEGANLRGADLEGSIS